MKDMAQAIRDAVAAPVIGGDQMTMHGFCTMRHRAGTMRCDECAADVEQLVVTNITGAAIGPATEWRLYCDRCAR